jgi:hypothetical protein
MDLFCGYVNNGSDKVAGVTAYSYDDIVMSIIRSIEEYISQGRDECAYYSSDSPCPFFNQLYSSNIMWNHESGMWTTYFKHFPIRNRRELDKFLETYNNLYVSEINYKINRVYTDEPIADYPKRYKQTKLSF